MRGSFRACFLYYLCWQCKHAFYFFFSNFQVLKAYQCLRLQSLPSNADSHDFK